MALPEEQRVERELEVRVGDVPDAKVLVASEVMTVWSGGWTIVGGLDLIDYLKNETHLDGHFGQEPRVEHPPRGVTQGHVHHAGGGGEGGGGLEQGAQEVGGLAVVCVGLVGWGMEM